MAKNFRGKSFLKLIDFSSDDIRYLLELSKDFKSMKRAGVPHKYLEGKNIAIIFEKTSTRTRCSFEVAGYDLGMGVTYLDPTGSQMGHKESVADTARVLGRMYDGIEFRGFKQEHVEELAKYAGVPVWNGLTDKWHPTQMLADVLTIEEHFGYSKGLKFVYFGDARNNMANSLMIVCAKLGINFVACAPKELFPEEELVKLAKKIAAENFSTIELTEDVKAASKGANVIYTDVWVSMGEPAEEWEKRIKILKPYQVTKEIMANADKEAIFLHCLPAFHDKGTKVGQEIYEKYGMDAIEVTDEVFESKQSYVFDQAENRMHTIKAIMYATLC
ncbi:ornithine carbamoyltransferase [Peptoniphilus sp. GNH]|nr:ornithine carbamoyltransferase [Clostridiales bacterium KA00134]UHR03384.1 ornithine carbamoyltransferase [Peptoniphilus sp. GNH]